MTAEGAPCTEIGPHLWFSDDYRERARAVALCGSCHAVAWCREQGEGLRAEGHRLFGVWGGVDNGMAHGAPAHPGARVSTPGLAPAGCGTEAGARRHRRHGEKVCTACREAANAARRGRGYGATAADEAPECGTESAYRWHRARGQECETCSAAMSERWRRQSAARRDRERMGVAS